jgi:anti-anti-sigma factor
VCLIRVVGDLDRHACPVLEQALEPFLDDQRVQHLVLDASQITYVDSEGIRALLHVRRALQRHSAQISIRSATGILRRALAATGLAWLFE